MKFSLVTPQKLLAEHEATQVVLPGEEGNFGVLDGHMALIATLREDATLFVDDADGHRTYYTVSGGFADVNAEGVTVLAEQAAKEDAQATA